MKIKQLQQGTYKVLGSLTVALIILAQAVGVSAEDASEIEKKAREVTVQINNIEGRKNGGSGVIVGKKGNTYTVVTADHVICKKLLRSPSECENLTFSIRTHQGRDYPVNIVKRFSSDGLDLAVVSFESSADYPYAKLGDAKHMEAGSSVYPVGFPNTQQRSFAFRDGFVVAQLTRAVKGYTIQYAARTEGGMSGGPVFDNKGRVIGIHGLARTSTEHEAQSSASSTVKSAFSAAIPINKFNSWCNLDSLCPSLEVDDSRPDENPGERLRNPNSARDFYAKALTLHATRQYGTAINLYDAALEKNPGYADAYRHRGLAYIYQRNYQQAIDDWTKAIDNGYISAEIYHHRGLAYTRLNDFQRAENDYNTALGITNGNYAPAHHSLGDIYTDRGDRPRAIASYTKAIELDSNYADAYFNRATVYNNLGMELYKQSNLQESLNHLELALSDFKHAENLLLDSDRSGAHQEARNNIRQVEKNINIVRPKLNASQQNPFGTGPVNTNPDPLPNQQPTRIPNPAL